MLYLSLREVLIRNASGTHDQLIPAGEPTLVIPLLYDAANAAGCVPCDEAGNVVQPGKTPDKAGVQPEVESEEEASGVIGYTIGDVKAAVEAVIARNNKADFGATGRPKVGPVATILGHKPTADEITDAWNRVEAD